MREGIENVDVEENRVSVIERSLRPRSLSRFGTRGKRNVEREGRKCVRCATNRIIEFSIEREGIYIYIYIYRRDSRKGCAGEGEGMIDGTSRLSRKLL